MREIKFRAWDRTYGRFVQIDTTYYLNRDGEFDTTMFADEKGLSPILLQSTGLLDKNGIAIYEGDIVTCEGFGGSYKVEYEGCSFIGRHTQNSQWVDLEMQELEIIGNIYENHELLTHE